MAKSKNIYLSRPGPGDLKVKIYILLIVKHKAPQLRGFLFAAKCRQLLPSPAKNFTPPYSFVLLL